MLDVKLAKLLSLALFHLVTALAKQFTGHRISGRPMRVHFSIRGLYDSKCLIILPFPNSSSWNWWSSTQGVETLFHCSSFSSLLARSICPRTSSHGDRFEQVLVLVGNLTICLWFSLDASQVHLIKKRGLLQINVLHHFLPHGTPDSVSSQPS